MQNETLKSAKFFQPYNPDLISERYVVENTTDLELFFKAFSHNRKLMQNTLKKSLVEGRIILLTDSTLSGFTSYCFETVLSDTKKLEDVHPSSFIRVEEEDAKEKFGSWTASELFDFLQSNHVIADDEAFEEWMNDRTDMIDMAVEFVES